MLLFMIHSLKNMPLLLLLIILLCGYFYTTHYLGGLVYKGAYFLSNLGFHVPKRFYKFYSFNTKYLLASILMPKELNPFRFAGKDILRRKGNFFSGLMICHSFSLPCWSNSSLAFLLLVLLGIW